MRLRTDQFTGNNITLLTGPKVISYRRREGGEGGEGVVVNDTVTVTGIIIYITKLFYLIG